MSQAGVRKKGYLFKLPVTGIVKKWAKRWCVLYGTSHEGVVRIEYYVDETSERSQIGKRTIPLRDCSKIQQSVGDKLRPYVFEFTTQLGQHVFAAVSNPELEEWLDGIKDAVHEDRMKRKMNKTQTKKGTTSAPPRPSSQPQSSNSESKATEYAPVQAKGFSKGSTHTASSIKSGTYRVTLEENETTDELDLHGSFNLVLAPTSIAIVDVDTGKPIYKWHYKYLKSFGKQSGRFNFEVGKTPQGGTGSYKCVTTCSKEIFGVVNRNIKTIRELMEIDRKEQLQKNARHSRNSGVADDTVPGKYRSSRNMEQAGAAIGPGEPLDQQNEGSELTEQDVQNNYSLAEVTNEPPDVSDLYAKVNKPPKKGGATPTSQAEEQQQASTTDAQPTNRFSYDSTLDTRDSALIQLDGPMLDLEALTPNKPIVNVSNVLDIDLNDEFFTQATSTVATGVDPWGGGQTASSGNVQNPWGGVGDGGQHFTSYGQSTGYGQMPRYGQMPGYGQSAAAYGQPMPGQMQGNPWNMLGHGQQSAGFGFQQQPQQPQEPQKVLSQQEFDQLWDELCASTTNF